MTLEFHGGSVWGEITELVAGSTGQIQAAIAYVGKEAPRLLPLKTGDVLIVNASERSLRSGATNPYVLEEFMGAGVEVHNAHALHAKVITTDTHTIVGSANASENSSIRCQEAFMVSSTVKMRHQVRDFVDTLLGKHSAQVLHEELPEFKRIFDSNPDRPKITGVTSPPERNGLFGDNNEKFYLCRVEWDGDLTKDEEEFVLGSTDAYVAVETLYIDSTVQLTELDPGYETGDIVIFHNGKSFRSPAKVLGEPISFMRESGEQIYGQPIRQFSGMITRRRSTVDKVLEKLSLELNDAEFQNSNFHLNEPLRNGFVRLWHPEFGLETA